MQSLNNKKSIIRSVYPVATFTLPVYFVIFLLVSFLTGCSGGGESGSQSITSPVVAITGPIVAARVGETAVLDGSKSFASSSAAISYSWSFTHKPDASKTKLHGATTVNPSFVADAKGVYTVQLVTSVDGVPSQRAIQLVVATLAGEPATGPSNHVGLSSNCVSCHDGVLVDPAKSPDHVATSNLCQSCHTPQGAAIIPFVDHLEVFGNCSECHDGITAIGKSASHTSTDAECDNCHNTTSFLQLQSDGSFDHSNITSGCNGCHNGSIATGKTSSGSHPDTNSECGSCHTTTSFLDAYPDHNGPDVVGADITCDSCHVADGTGLATGQITGHPITNVDCDICHSTKTFSLGGVFNHRVIDPAIQRCDSCHNTNNSINAIAKTPTATHDGTTSDCGLCHNTENFAAAFVDHSEIVDNCASCHNGSDATGKSINHMPTIEDCSVCHAPGSFTTGTYDHDGVVSGCTSCHDNVISIGKLGNHIPTNPGNQDCADCHFNTSSFSGATFDHAGIVNDCASCHDGKISIGKSANHVQTDLLQANLDCSSCHVTNTFNTFAGTFVHDLTVVDNNCASCHNAGIATPKKVNHIPALDECSACHDDTNAGGFVSTTFLATEHPGINSGCEGCHTSRFIPDNPNVIKAVSHLPTGQDCDVCHTNDAFIPSVFDHMGIIGNCVSCHDGNNVAVGARGTTADHPATNGKDCGVCHNTVTFSDATFDHTGRVDNCTECHGDGATGAVTKKNIGHVTTTEDCSVCHVPGTFTTAVFNHTGIVDNCASCHNGSDATGKDAKTNPAHIPTTEDCSVCHIPTVFADARFDHQGIVDNCASCHDGVTARGKSPPPNHVPTNGDCSDCHQTTGFVPGTFDHVGIVDNCRSCHDGAFAIGKTSSHIPTDQDCSVCHTTGSFIGAGFNHTGIVDNCESCHDGVTAIGKDAKTNPAHLDTALDCHSCHTTATFLGGTWIHDASSTGQCDTCHTSTGGARAKPSGHLSTTVQCDECHSTNGWSPSNFSHDPQGGYPGNHRIDPGCSGCHGGTIDNTLPYSHPQYAPPQRNTVYCAACHANDFDRKGDHIGGENGTVEQNKNCAGNGCHRVSDSDFD